MTFFLQLICITLVPRQIFIVGVHLLQGRHTMLRSAQRACNIPSGENSPHLHVLENLSLSVVDYEGTVALDERQLKDHGLPRHPQVTCNNLILAAVIGGGFQAGRVQYPGRVYMYLCIRYLRCTRVSTNGTTSIVPGYLPRVWPVLYSGIYPCMTNTAHPGQLDHRFLHHDLKYLWGRSIPGLTRFSSCNRVGPAYSARSTICSTHVAWVWTCALQILRNLSEKAGGGNWAIYCRK